MNNTNECGCGRSPTGKCVGWHDLSEDEYKNAILGTGFEVVKVISVDGIITDDEEARKLID